MGIASKYNNGTIDWGIDTKGFEYHPLHEAGEGMTLNVYGLYINNKSKFEPAPVLIAADRYYNLPSYMTETVKAMLQDDELIAAIKDRKVGATVRKFIDKKYGRESWTVDWIDL